jgi:integrase
MGALFVIGRTRDVPKLPGGKGFYNPTQLGREWAAYAKAYGDGAGLVGTQGVRVNYHDLRHTFATAAAPRADMKTLSESLGHATVAFTMDRYADVEDSKARELGDVMDAIMAPRVAEVARFIPTGTEG